MGQVPKSGEIEGNIPGRGSTAQGLPRGAWPAQVTPGAQVTGVGLRSSRGSWPIRPEWSLFKGVQVRRTWEGLLESWGGKGCQASETAWGWSGLPGCWVGGGGCPLSLSLSLVSPPCMLLAVPLVQQLSSLFLHLVKEDAPSVPSTVAPKVPSRQVKSMAETTGNCPDFAFPGKASPAWARSPPPTPVQNNKGLCVQGPGARAGRCPLQTCWGRASRGEVCSSTEKPNTSGGGGGGAGDAAHVGGLLRDL